MSKVLFISTPYENLGIEYMSAILKSAGHQVHLIIDPCLFFNPYQKNPFLHNLFDYNKNIIQKVKEIKPDLISFSVMTDTYQWGLALARNIKREMDIPVLFGGIHPTIAPEVVIKEDPVDYVCVGEGEEAMLDLANRCHNPRDCTHIPNLWTKNNSQILKNQPRPLLQELDNLPFPDKDLFYSQSKIYSNEYFIMTSRGCNYSCSYCCNQLFLKIYGKNFLRRRSVNNIIRELDERKNKYHFKFVWFMDDIFAVDTSWLNEFAREYKKYIDLPFFCYINPNSVTSEIAHLLKKAGCHEAGIGVQTLNETTCKLINRNNDRELVKNCLATFKENHILSITENILGLPEENENDILKLIHFYNDNRPDLIVFSWLKVFPKTPLFDYFKEKNLISETSRKDILAGKDKSLALGGTVVDVKTFKKAACLLVLVPFLPKFLVNFFLKTRLFKCFFLVNPNTLLQFIRIYKTTKLAGLLTGGRTYDVGAKVSLRIYRSFLKKKITNRFFNPESCK